MSPLRLRRRTPLPGYRLVEVGAHRRSSWGNGTDCPFGSRPLAAKYRLRRGRDGNPRPLIDTRYLDRCSGGAPSCLVGPGQPADAGGTRGRYLSSMTNGDEKLHETLRLARDLCLGLGAFFVSPEREVVSILSPAVSTPDVGDRVEVFARTCTSHPGAHGNTVFWNAEVVGEGRTMDETLACVAIPLRTGVRWMGLLGVVDTWLPELDEEQHRGFIQLAGILAAHLGETRSEEPVTIRSDPAVIARMPGAGLPENLYGDRFLGEVVDHLPEGLMVVRDDGTIIFASGTIAAMSGLSPDEIVGGDVGSFLALDEAQSAGGVENVGAASLLGTPSPGRRLRMRSATGSELDVDASGSHLSSRIVGECCVALLRGAPEPVAVPIAGPVDSLAYRMLDSLDEGIIVCDAGRVVRIANREALRLQGLPVELDLVGHPFPAVTAMCASDGSPLALASHPLTRALHGAVVRGEQLLLGAGEGTRHDIVASARPLEVNGGSGALLVLRDVTTQLQEQAWLAHLALHDPLTGLANRNLLIDQLRRMLAHLRSRGGGVALVFLDLDDFKGVNDRFGHDVGDEVLVAVGRRIEGAVRSSDLVARLGGDEFVIAHSSTDERADVEVVVSRIRKALAAPYLIKGQPLAVTASVGSVVADPRHEDPINLLVRADREMYRRKKAQRREPRVGS